MLTNWAVAYRLDPALVRALAWMESGYQIGLVSSAGARGVLQVLPATRGYVEQQLIRHRVPRSTSGNIRIGVAYLRQLLREFSWSRERALAAWYQVGLSGTRPEPEVMRNARAGPSSGR